MYPKLISGLAVSFLGGIGYAQNIGIGTTTPADRLTVRSASNGFGITQETADGTVRVGFHTTPGTGAFLQTHTNHDLQFATNNGPAHMVLQRGTGLVGIGNTSPSTAGLVVDRRVGAVNAMFGSNTSGVAIESNFPGIGLNSYFEGSRKAIANGFTGYMGMNPATGDLIFANSAQAGQATVANAVINRMVISNEGNIGIGTGTPQHPLTFSSLLGDKISFWGGTGSATMGHYGIGIANSALQLYSAGPNDDIVFGHGRSGAFVENVRMKGNGSVGIGTSNPTAKLQVNGTLRIADGTQGTNKVLVSSADGTAGWAGATFFRTALATTFTNPSIIIPQDVTPGFLSNSNTYSSSSQMLNLSTGVVTVPTAGVYQLNLRVAARINFLDVSSTAVASIQKFENGNWVNITFEEVRYDGGVFQRDAVFKHHTVAFLDANQQIRVRVKLLSGTRLLGDDSTLPGFSDTEFSGVLLR